MIVKTHLKLGFKEFKKLWCTYDSYSDKWLYILDMTLHDKKDLYELFLTKIPKVRVKRSNIGRTKRQKIYSRDSWKCRFCGSESNLTLDHIIPLSKGGTNHSDNLMTLCHDCNNKKSSTIYKKFIQ